MIRRLIPTDVTYTAYLARQAEKARATVLEAKMQAQRPERVSWFRSRFASLDGDTAICLGARYGEEVEALRGLGWSATGVDIDSHPPWVESGDMNARHFGRFDFIYSNAFDHCWEPDSFLGNIRDALTAEGRFMLHVSDGAVGEFETVAWDELADVLGLLADAGLTVLRADPMPEFYGLTTEIVGRC